MARATRSGSTRSDDDEPNSSYEEFEEVCPGLIPSHLTTAVTIRGSINVARVGQPVIGSPLPSAAAAVATVWSRSSASSSPAPETTACRKRTTVSSVHPVRSRPPARARAALWRVPSPGQWRASSTADASRPTRDNRSSAVTVAGSPSLSQSIASPEGWIEPGKRV
jgi:hypothetical protein